jgi:hypothetical protein
MARKICARHLMPFVYMLNTLSHLKEIKEVLTLVSMMPGQASQPLSTPHAHSGRNALAQLHRLSL